MSQSLTLPIRRKHSLSFEPGRRYGPGGTAGWRTAVWSWPVAFAVIIATLAMSPGSGAPVVPSAGGPLVPTGSVWHYLDDGSDQGTAWQALGFDHSTWASGPAQLGYGDGDEATVVSFGGSHGAKFTTTYYRHTFQVADPTTLSSASLNLLRDDGAIVYLNEVEVARSNMPAGAVDYLTFASKGIASNTETEFYPFSVDPGLLLQGSNVLAVEIHQWALNSSDTSFDLEFRGSGPAVVRGPYLQRGTPSSTVVRWRTDQPTATTVWLGASET